MDVRVQGAVPAAPFLSARDLFETEYDLDKRVDVQVREDPDERTWTAHYDDRHVLNISRKAATGAMARELALHEFAHMRRNEGDHPSHTQSTREALFLALAGHSVEKHKIAHCYQIANHMKDIYADDITLHVGPSDKLVSFLESSLAGAVRDRPGDVPGGWHRHTGGTDPEITAVNAAFALALVERHDLVADDHRIYDLAHAAASDAPGVDFEGFRTRFRDLAEGPSESTYRSALVDATREYATDGGRAAD
ncbi:hypothetical protein BRD00_04350 [Halobacteriales archaeon QS_8_69_26]|nr:MAG: hypothetical protein BRD00_04350 [Halobacteriales archaeon QS_8_69_26]